MARKHLATPLRLLALLVAALLLAACDYGGSPSGSGTLAASDGGSTTPPDPVMARLAWSGASGPVDGYRVFEARDGNSFQQGQDVPAASVDVTGTPGETLQIMVAAIDDQGNEGPMSPPSATLVFTGQGVELAPVSASMQGGAIAGGEAAVQRTVASASATDTASPANAESADGASGDDAGAPASETAKALDMDGSGTSDLLWVSSAADRLRITNSDFDLIALFDRPDAAWELGAMADLDGDGLTDLLWIHESGDLALSRMAASLGSQPALDLLDVGRLGADDGVRGSGDFDGDGAAELLVADTASGGLSLWSLDAGGDAAVLELGFAPAAGEAVAGDRDYDGDGVDDVLLEGEDGLLSAWLLGADGVRAFATLGADAGGEVLASGDFDGDGVSDVARRSLDGGVELLLLGGGLDQPVAVAGLGGATLERAGTGDLDGDGRSDLLWHDANGDLVVWFFDPGAAIDALSVSLDAGWSLVADWR